MWSPYRLDTECRCMLGVVDLQLTMSAREARDVYLYGGSATTDGRTTRTVRTSHGY